MITIRNDLIELTATDDAASVVLTNRPTATRWLLDPATVLADGSSCDRVPFGPNRKRGYGNLIDDTAPPATAFHHASVQQLGNHTLQIRLQGPAGQLVLLYELTFDGCRVTALAGQSTATSCALPGAFRPEGVDAPPVALPKNQGIWHRGTGDPFCLHLVREGHGGWSMPFAGVVGPKDALVHIIETEHDARIWFEKTPAGHVLLTSLQDPTRGKLRYNRSVLLRFTEPNLTAICQTYRQYIQQTGHFTSWDEKLDKRPNLQRLFGALMCFIGYCQDEHLDYAASLRRLKTMGFDKAFVYPLSIGNPVQDFLMGGRPPIDIRRLLPLLDELGYLAASWMWVEDGSDVPDDLMFSPDGKSMLSWQIEDRKWLRTCPVRQVAISNRIQDKRMAGNTAEHFDVTASRQLLECHHPDHPLDRRDDALWRRKILATGTARGCVISSEGFWGFAAPSYDIGSVKIPVPVHADWYTVPMTSLVYHDSCIHDWWEVDNYNNPHHRNQGERDKGYFPIGGGFQAFQACQDALAGFPPNVMPFGSQYAFVAGQMPATELYRYTLDSPEVIEALRLALPVAHLHNRIGKLPCIQHETLAPDGSLQSTTFADGTRIIVNYSNEPRDIPPAGLLPPTSWRAS